MTLPSEQVASIADAIGGLEEWRHQCHAASLAVVRTGLLPDDARVARGWHPKLKGQHSWVVIGDPYDPSMILDPTLWSYTDEDPHLLVQDGAGCYSPHGSGSIWKYGKPAPPTGEVFDVNDNWSDFARSFFDMIGYGLDRRGWAFLASAPVLGWPASEIITAMYRDERTASLVPIDIVGMVTEENPGNLYW